LQVGDGDPGDADILLDCELVMRKSMSYHQGSVWPLYTGWMAMAEYRAGRAFAGYAHLMQNADMTFSPDPGAVTELLSGEFFQPFGRSSSHQLWSSAMVMTPTVRGLFGLEADASGHVLRVHRQLSPGWDGATLRNVAVGGARFDVRIRREGSRIAIEASSREPQLLCVTAGTACDGAPVVAQSADGFDIEGVDGSVADVDVRFLRMPARVTGASSEGGKLVVRLPAGEGYRRVNVSFSW
jgi:hypothetical protein